MGRQSSAFEESLASICGGRGTHYLVLHTDLGSRGHRSCFYLSIQVSDRSRHALASLFLLLQITWEQYQPLREDIVYLTSFVNSWGRSQVIWANRYEASHEQTWLLSTDRISNKLKENSKCMHFDPLSPGFAAVSSVQINVVQAITFVWLTSTIFAAFLFQKWSAMPSKSIKCNIVLKWIYH